jgi:hypothetical protein
MTQGIPSLPDITQPQQLIQLSSQLFSFLLVFSVFVVLFGLILALINFSMRFNQSFNPLMLESTKNYRKLVVFMFHGGLVLCLCASGFVLCSTLANRYHYWEQANIAKITEKQDSSGLEQSAPKVRYEIEEVYFSEKIVDGNTIEVERKRNVDRYLSLKESNVKVKLDQILVPQTQKSYYRSSFFADYKLANALGEPKKFYFESPPPKGFSLLQSFKVERDGKPLVQVNPGDYGFSFQLNPGEETTFRVTYQSQGGASWVYNSYGNTLAGFRLDVVTTFPNVEFASGISPTESMNEGNGKRITWIYSDNVAVLNPFGVFTAIAPIRNTGVIPRLLMLSPILFVWWLILLYLSVPLSLRNVAIAGGVFFACLLSLTYCSRVIDSRLAWSGISFLLLALIWGLEHDRRLRSAILICTVSGMILPVLGLLVPISGLMLSVAGLMSAIWIVVRKSSPVEDLVSPE